MWNPFRNSNKNASTLPRRPAGNDVNRVDELANNLQRDGRIGDLERELQRFDQRNLSPAERESWWHLLGIIAFREGRDAEALERFEAAHTRFPSSAQIRFSLGQQYIRTGAVERGFDLFRTCSFPELPREYALAQARYAYIWGRYGDGILFIRPFFEAYKQVRVLDDHFLYVRGLPFFGRWWAYLVAFSILSSEFEELESVTQFVTQNCHDYDFESLQVELQAYQDNSPERLLAALETRLSRMRDGEFPTGYTRMNIAVIKARAASTVAAAQEVLGSVALSERDFPWLEDIRTLALSEAAHRLGDRTVEQECVEKFLTRQPMLFEPDIALSFHLLRYQENLKARVTGR